MVFPSNACNTCKSRRIKCDSSRPSCDRCRKASRTCTWGSDKSQSWPFKNENDFAKGKPRRPRANHDTPLPQNTLHVVTQPPPLGISLSLPIEVYALNYWVTHFTAWPNGLQEIESEYGACALRFWEDCDSRSTLRLAVFAFALAKFGKAVRSSSAIKNAELVYWSCIKRMQAEVASVSNETIDQLLVATVLMALYDNIMHQGKESRSVGDFPAIERSGHDSHPLPHTGHCRGTTGLLQIRRRQGWGSIPYLDRAVRGPIVRSCLVQGVSTPDWLQEPTMDSIDPAAMLDDLSTRLTILRSKCLRLIHQSDNNIGSKIEHLQSLIANAQGLDRAYEAWECHVSDEWGFLMSHSEDTDMLKSDFYEGSAHVYLTLGQATIWNRYRVSRLIISSTLLRLVLTLVKFLPRNCDLESQIQRCKSTIDCLATEVCCSTAFFFKSTKSMSTRGTDHSNRGLDEISPMAATLLAWPLTIAISIEFVPSKQKIWLRKKLNYISVALGTDLLSVVADNGFTI